MTNINVLKQWQVKKKKPKGCLKQSFGLVFGQPAMVAGPGFFD